MSREAFIAAITTSLIVISFVTIAAVPKVHSAQWSAQEETLSVARFLFELDMTKYNPQLISDTIPPNSAAGTEDVLFTLGNVSYLHRDVDFSCSFTNQKLATAMFSVNNGTPLYTEEQPANALDATKAFLERYQEYSGASYVQAMHNMLNNINSTENIDLSSGGIRLRVTTGEFSQVSFRFDKVVNGVETQEWLEVAFEHSYLSLFVDKWNTFTVGSTEINLTNNEAIGIGRNYLKTFSWNVSQGDGNLIEVNNFSVLETPVDVSMWMYPRPQGSSTVYPHYHVVFYLDKIYAGGVSNIAVGVWADTGGIVYCTPLSYGGNPPDSSDLSTPPSTFPNPTSMPTTSPSPSIPEFQAWTILPFLIAATTAVLAYTKKKKAKNY